LKITQNNLYFDLKSLANDSVKLYIFNQKIEYFVLVA